MSLPSSSASTNPSDTTLPVGADGPVPVGADGAGPDTGGLEKRDWRQALRRGLAQRCPSCGQKTLYQRYLKLVPHCPTCGLDTGEYRTDDAPAYLTLFLAVHILAPVALTVDQWVSVSFSIMLVIWIPVMVGLCLWLLPRIKGGVLAIQWANRIKG